MRAGASPSTSRLDKDAELVRVRRAAGKEEEARHVAVLLGREAHVWR